MNTKFIKNKLFHEISAGGVVFEKRKNGIFIVVIKRNCLNDWTLPKGHQEKKESLQETATREVLEETGITAEPIAYIGKFTYSANDLISKKTFLKTVHWWIMEVKSKKPYKANDEVLKVKWVNINDNLDFMNYKNDRQMIKRAIKTILSRKYKNKFI